MVGYALGLAFKVTIEDQIECLTPGLAATTASAPISNAVAIELRLTGHIIAFAAIRATILRIETVKPIIIRHAFISFLVIF